MVCSDWLEEGRLWRVVWSSATMVPGAQYVMTYGVLLKLRWSADSWDTLIVVKWLAIQVIFFFKLALLLLLLRSHCQGKSLLWTRNRTYSSGQCRLHWK